MDSNLSEQIVDLSFSDNNANKNSNTFQLIQTNEVDKNNNINDNLKKLHESLSSLKISSFHKSNNTINYQNNNQNN